MTDEQSLLNPPADQQEVDPNKNYLEELVGDGKKFKTPEELARGKYEADLFIANKNRQFDALAEDYKRLRDDYNSRAKLEEIEDRIANLVNQQVASSDNNHQANERDQTFGNSQTGTVLSPDEMKAMVEDYIRKYELSKVEQTNFNEVRNKLIERYGNSYPDVIRKQLDEMGMTEAMFNNMARVSPKAVYKALGVDQQPSEQFQAPPRAQQRPSSFAPNVSKRTWSYYQNLKKTDPVRYLDPKTQTQMHRDAVELGDAFKDGDYNKYG